MAYLSPQWGQVLALASALGGSIVLQVLNPQILRYFIDTALAGGPQRVLVVAALGFMAIAVVRQGLEIIATYFSETVAWTATNNLRLNLAQHTLNLDLNFHKSHNSGELVERIDGDVDALARFFSQFVLQVLGNGLLVISVLGVLWFEQWQAGLGLTLFALLALGILSWLQSLAVEPWAIYRGISADFYDFITEYLRGLEDIRGNGAVGYVMDRFYRLMGKWLKAFHQARLTSTLLWGSTVGLFTVGNAVALALGAYLWRVQGITIGTVYLFFYYASLLQEPIERIREELEQFQQAVASLHRIKALIRYPPKSNSGKAKTLPDGPLSVRGEGVWFSYPTTKALTPKDMGKLAQECFDPGQADNNQHCRYALQNLTWHLPPGQVLGLLGHTGSGKSTFARLLLNFYDPQRGHIYLGGVNLGEICRQDFHHRVGFVTQDVQLFQTSIRNNLTFFNPHIPDQRILEALSYLGLKPWLATLPKGLETELGTDGGGLSAGQAQLLAFARVFLKNPGLVILDEASSRLDPMTEQLIDQAINRLLEHRTGVIIAHRLKTVERADQILILDRGKILEYGDRLSLLANPQSHFRQLLKHSNLDEMRGKD
ncbi:ATP-binding protein of ABC transporter [Synechocystis sp. PCC 6714]|nr:ATP-binding protein of ABC transporter [Synechocystis sp. PCC 6714]